MKQHEANKILEERLASAYAGGITVIWANAPVRRTVPIDRFATFDIDPISSSNPWLGAAKTRTSGMIIIELFVPLGEGDRLGVQQAGEFADVFHNQDFSGVMCYERRIDVVGAVTLTDEDIRQFKIACLIPFYYDRVA